MTQRPILLVEDDRDIREILAEVLMDAGYDVVTAEHGQQALAIIRGSASPPSAVVLDLMMPVMDGYGFLEERRKDPALRSIPVVVVTAAHRIDRSKIDDAPVIRKPINLPELIRFLEEQRV